MISAIFTAAIGLSLAVLAPRNIFLTYVDEGEGRIIRRFGARRKLLLQWAGYVVTKDLSQAEFENTDLRIEDPKRRPDWDIVLHPDPEKRKRTPKERRFGGLRIVGIPWIDKVLTYNLRWPGIKLVKEGTLEVVFYEERLDYFLAKTDLYLLKMVKIETRPPERFRTSVAFQWPMRIANPRKAFFVGPPNIIENTIARMNGWFRPWIGTKNLDELLGLKGKALNLSEFKEFVPGDSDIPTELDKWGMVIEGPVLLAEVEAPQEVIEALEAERKAEWLAKASSESVMRFFLHSLALAQGKEVKEVQQEFGRLSTEEKQKQLYPFLEEMARIRLALEKRAYFEIRTEGGKVGDISGTVREFIATGAGLVARVIKEGGEK